MAKRSLADGAAPKSALLMRTARSVNAYQKEVTQDTDINERSEEQKSRLI